jgi:hypothetical protein
MAVQYKNLTGRIHAGWMSMMCSMFQSEGLVTLARDYYYFLSSFYAYVEVKSSENIEIMQEQVPSNACLDFCQVRCLSHHLTVCSGIFSFFADSSFHSVDHFEPGSTF